MASRGAPATQKGGEHKLRSLSCTLVVLMSDVERDCSYRRLAHLSLQELFARTETAL